jgi:WS/DGAT/MGAT family acyltransferase
MKQLTGLDGSFLYMETPTSFGHVNGLAIYERPDGDFDPYATVYRRFASKVGELEPMRRRVVEVPMGLDHPYWVMDPNFDLDFHIRHMSLAPPGRRDQLAEQVARIVGRPMDRTRPLWEVYVIEGLEDGSWALLTKYHHATIDGASGVLMMTLLNDLTPDAPPPGESPPWEPEEIPSDAELLRLAIGNLVRNPAKALRLQLRIVRDFAAAAGITGLSSAAQQAGAAVKALAGPQDGPRVSMPMSAAPPTPWNKSITAHRRFAMRAAKVSDLKRLKAVTGGTLNDVVMAIVAGALRAYLAEHDALPDAPLRAMVPVSIRTGNEEEPWTNRVSSLVVDLPTHLADPLERLASCREAMDRAKRQFELVPAEALVDIQQYSSPVVATSAIRLAARLKLADRMAPPVNVIISNVPGPRQPLYLGGAEMRTYIPVSTIAEGMGLNVTVHSYLDELEFGLIACRELVPDLWHMVDLHLAEIDVLFAAAGLPRTEGVVATAAPATRATRKAAAPRARKAAATRAARTATARKATAKKAAPAKRSAAKKATARKATAKKAAPAKRSAAKKATATKTAATKTAATKATAKKAAPAKRSAAKKSAAKKAAATRAAS